jgi:hypothetical protein
MRDYPSHRAPRADGSWLCEPEPNKSSSLIAFNQQLLDGSDVRWLGLPLSELRRRARNDLLQAADRYSKNTSELHSLPLNPLNDHREVGLTKPMLMSGHQPELFHAGVWFKNFLLSTLAKKNRGVAVNVLVDHDLAKRTRLEVPKRSKDCRLTKATIDLDTRWSELPWEHAVLGDTSSWDRFVESVCEDLSSVGIEKPLLTEMNACVRDAIRRGRSLGEAIATARHRMELDAGLSTMEIPFSHLALSQAWTAFTGEVIFRAEEVHTSYNRAREEYRASHEIKSPAQPLPPLGRDGSWIETPFWIYSKSHPRRQPLWVRRQRSSIELSDLHAWRMIFQVDSHHESWLVAFRKISDSGLQIRPRALTTTMFLRLAMCDLFIHGIGGGRYDQLTNNIIGDLWGLESPSFVVATATLHLPIKRLPSKSSSCLEVVKRLRDWRFTPERLVTCISTDILGKSLLESKRRLLESVPEGQAKGAWHRSVMDTNQQIRSHFAEQGDGLNQQYAGALEFERELAILNYREFSFTLFEKELIDRLLGLVASENGESERIKVS